MPDDVASSPLRTTFVGRAVASDIPASIPILVVPHDAMNGATGPLPVSLEHGERTVQAWAWSQHAWGQADRAPAPSDPGSELTFSLTKTAAEGLGISDQLGQRSCSLSAHIPVPTPIAPVVPLVQDPPESDEVQVSTDLQELEGHAVLIRNGVAASVVVTALDHVQQGTVRISAHLRTITDPTATAGPHSRPAFLLPSPRLSPAGISADAGFQRRLVARVSAGLQASTERALRWFFGAEKQAMRVVYAHPYDEHQYSVSMTEVALLRLGMDPGDKAVLNWLGTDIEVTVLQDHEPVDTSAGDQPGTADPTRPGPALGMSPHLAVRVPTALRHIVNMPAASIVTMRRSTRSVLARNLHNLIIPVASLALAGAALDNANWWLLGLGAVATAILGLSRLRMNNRRAIALGRGK